MTDNIVSPQTQPHWDKELNVPIPDPSLLTTQQLLREISSLKELVFSRFDGFDNARTLLKNSIDKHIDHLTELQGSKISATDNASVLIRNVIETRLDGMDKAIRLLQDTADKFPARIDEKISALREVHEQKFAAITETHGEKFGSIQTQFKERDVRTEQSSKDSKVAVDAALQAAKEAVGEQNKSSALAIAKSENATTKQIDQLAVLIQTMTKGFDDKIGDVKDRLTRIEGKGEGTRTQISTQNTSNQYILAIIVGIGGLILTLFMAFWKH